MAISHLSVDESLIANEIAGNKYRENPNGVFRTRVMKSRMLICLAPE
jgi:hypothetical protein